MASPDLPAERASAGAAPSRLHFLDALRGTLMVLGIPYHSAVAFSGTTWLITNDQESTALRVFIALFHMWRMPAFFLIAGFFALLVLRRRGAATWYRGRLTRLGVPLLCGVLLLNPVQRLILARYRHGAWVAAVHEWLGDVAAWSGVFHLWFLVDLLVYCTLLAALHASPWRAAAGRAATAVADWALGSAFRALLLIGAAALAVALGLAAWSLSGVGAALRGTVTSTVVLYAPAFTAGAALALRPTSLRRATALGWPVPLVAAVCLAVLVTAAVVHEPPSDALAAVLAACSTVGGLCGALVALGLAARVADRRDPLVDWVVDASLTVYLVHHVFVLAFAAWLVPTDVPPLTGFVVALGLTVPCSVLTYELVNATPGLRFLMTGRGGRGRSLPRSWAQRRAATA